MISAIVDPYPDELGYSLLARTSERLGYLSPRSALEELFGNANVVPSVAFVSNLDRLVDRLPAVWNRGVEDFIGRLTLLPFFAPFLPANRRQRLIADMRENGGGALWMRIGLMASIVPSPSHLQYCPRCVQEDRIRFGETYWHRIHQVSGILVCPRHEAWLETSEPMTALHSMRHAYSSAESVVPQHPEPRSIEATAERHVLLFVARAAAWLLGRPDLQGDSLRIRSHYLRLLAELDLLTRSGRVRMASLKETVTRHYGECDAYGELIHRIRHSDDNWLARIVRKPEGAQHLLLHLLVLHALGGSIEGLFEAQQADRPFGESPWPCLNPASPHFGWEVIRACRMTRSSTPKGRPTGIFACSCGFIYARAGPDVALSDRCRRDRLIGVGRCWEEALVALWRDTTKTLKEIARQLQVDPNTAKRHAARLNLGQIRCRGRLRTPARAAAGDPDGRSAGTRAGRQRRERTCWLRLLRSGQAKAGITAIRSCAPSTYVWLYRHDRRWLLAHRPQHVTRKDRSCRVDWPTRDVEVSMRIQAAAEHLRVLRGRPRRVTTALLGRHIGQLALLQQHLGKMPMTRAALAGVVENREQFAVRRLLWTAAQYVSEGTAPRDWELVRRAGVDRLVHQPLLREVLRAALEACARAVREGDQRHLVALTAHYLAVSMERCPTHR